MAFPGQARQTADIAVIGAGAIGAAISSELASRGREVVVLERGPGWASGCSWGNAGLICPSHAGPWASVDDVTTAMRWMLRPDSPLGIKPSPALIPFMARLLTAGSDEVQRATGVSRRMCRESLAMHRDLSTRIDTGFHQSGLLDVYATAARLERGLEAAVHHREAGVRCEDLSTSGAQRLEPALRDDIAGGVFFPDEAHCDPARFVQSLGALAGQQGVCLQSGTDVLSINPTTSGVDLLTTQGSITANVVVLATGAWTGEIAPKGSPSMPLQGGKGHTIDLTAGERAPLERPVMLQEARVAVTPLDGRLRLAGTMQFNGLDETINARRAATVHRDAMDILPSWSDAPVERLWSGLRPCTPDGLPFIGWLREGVPVAVATGHAMLGLTLAPLTGKQVADLIDGTGSDDLAALDPQRFASNRWRKAAS